MNFVCIFLLHIIIVRYENIFLRIIIMRGRGFTLWREVSDFTDSQTDETYNVGIRSSFLEQSREVGLLDV